jgi:hypothetical protein
MRKFIVLILFIFLGDSGLSASDLDLSSGSSIASGTGTSIVLRVTKMVIDRSCPGEVKILQRPLE